MKNIEKIDSGDVSEMDVDIAPKIMEENAIMKALEEMDSAVKDLKEKVDNCEVAADHEPPLQNGKETENLATEPQSISKPATNGDSSVEIENVIQEGEVGLSDGANGTISDEDLDTNSIVANGIQSDSLDNDTDNMSNGDKSGEVHTSQIMVNGSSTNNDCVAEDSPESSHQDVDREEELVVNSPTKSDNGVAESTAEVLIESTSNVNDVNTEEGEDDFEIPKSIEELLEEDVPSVKPDNAEDSNEEKISPSRVTPSIEVDQEVNQDSQVCLENGDKAKNDADIEASNDSSETKSRKASPIMMKFVDETSREDSDHETETSVTSSVDDDKAGQISLEAMDSQVSDDDSDEDIEAGLEKCFSALDRKLEKEKDSDLDSLFPDKSSAVLSEKNLDTDSSKDAVENHDDTSTEPMEASNDPSDAEEGGGHDADDEETRMSAPEVVEKVESVDYDKALGELEIIEKKTRKILDDEAPGDADSNKRSTAEVSDEPAAKKVKLEDDIKDTNEADRKLKKKLKKELKKLTRVALEDLIANKMVEVMTNKSEIGQLRHQCDSFAETVDKWKRRAAALSKQCTDLSTVMRKYITDSKNRPKDKVAPVRITRSVGLQVMTPDQRRLQQQRQNMANRQQAARAAVPARGGVRGGLAGPTRAVAPGAPSVARGGQVSPRPAGGQQVARSAVAAVVQPTPRQVGGTTISPAKTTNPVNQVRAGGAVTITQAGKPATTSTTSKPVIDVVDLSDDETTTPTPAPFPVKPAPPVVRQQLVSNGVRGAGMQQTRPRGQYVAYRGAGPGSRGGLLMQRGQTRAPIKSASQHPAPLPPMPNPQPNHPSWKLLPPRPALKISRVANGIVLSWNMNLNLATHAGISSYQLYAYQESSLQRPDPQLWKKVGDVKALPLPMACTLTQFTRGNKYHFAVRAMDSHSRVGQFSEPNSIVLN